MNLLKSAAAGTIHFLRSAISPCTRFCSRSFCCLLFFSFSGRKEEGTRLEISYRGEVIFTAGLEKDALYVFYIDGGKGKVIAGGDADGLSDYNVIEVKDGKASVVASDCADKVCFGNGVCLPHRMTLRIVSDDWETDL